MPQAYVTVYYHLIYRTKFKRIRIPEELLSDLYAYTGGIIREDKGTLIKAGGMPDHVHLVLSINKRVLIPDAVQHIKAGSSRWAHEHGFPSLRWQSGYSLFSVSPSVLPTLLRYIDNQKEHHKKMTFMEELIKFFKLHGTDYDPRYLKEEDDEE